MANKSKTSQSIRKRLKLKSVENNKKSPSFPLKEMKITLQVTRKSSLASPRKEKIRWRIFFWWRNCRNAFIINGYGVHTNTLCLICNGMAILSLPSEKSFYCLFGTLSDQLNTFTFYLFLCKTSLGLEH